MSTIANTMNVELLCEVIKQHIEQPLPLCQSPPWDKNRYPRPPIVEEVAAAVEAAEAAKKEAAKKVKKPRKPILSAKYQKMMSIGVWFIQHLKEAELLSEDKMVEAYDMLKIFNTLEEQIAFYKEYDDKDMKKSVKKIANEKKKAEKLANKPVKVRKTRVVDPNKPKTPRKNKKTCEIVNNQDNIISQLVVSSSNDINSNNINIPLIFDVDDVIVDKIVGGEDLEQTFVGEDETTFIGDDTTIVDDDEEDNDDNIDNNTTFNTTYTYDDEDTIIYDDLDVEDDEDDVPPPPTTPARPAAPERTSTPILQERRKTVTFDVAPLPVVVPVVPIVPIVAPIVVAPVVAPVVVPVAKTPAKPKQPKEPKTPKTPKAAVPKTPKTKTPKKVVEVVVEEEEQETLACVAYTFKNGLVVCLDEKTGKMYKEDGEEYSEEEIAELKKCNK